MQRRLTTIRLPLTIAFAGLFWFSSAFALDPAKAVSQYVHSVWPVDRNQLPGPAHSVLQTTDGYLWIGTEAGLARFDGARFVVYDKTTEPGLADNTILDILEDHQGVLWLATQGGLTAKTGSRFHTYTSRDGLANDYVISVFEDKHRRLWISTARGLSRLTEGRFETFTTRQGLAGDVVWAVFESADCDLCVSTSQGISQFDGRRFSAYQPVKERGAASLKLVGNTYVDPRGNLWVGTLGQGLVRLEHGQLRRWTVANGLASNTVFAMREDRDGNLWIGTRGGLSRLRDGHIQSYTVQDGLSNNIVRAITEDRESNLWLVTFGQGGLDQLRDGTFTPYTKAQGLSDAQIYAACRHRPGKLWAAGESGGLALLSGERFRPRPVPGLAATEPIASLAEGRTGALWIGTLTQGLKQLVHGQVRTFTVNDGLPSPAVDAILEDRQGTLWIGTNEGLVWFEQGQVSRRSAHTVLRGSAVLFLAEDQAGQVWAGTAQSGLSRWRHGSLTTWDTRTGLPSNLITGLLADGDGSLWVGTAKGLAHFVQGGLLSVLTTKSGLPEDSASEILLDAERNLWIGCSQGVYRLTRKEIEAYESRRISCLHPRRFDRSDGLPATSAAVGLQSSALRTEEGRLWFTTLSGLGAVHPSRIARVSASVPVRVEEVLIDQHLASSNAVVDLAPGTTKLEIHYTALRLSDAEKVQFRYRLQGFEKTWNQVGSRRVAFYNSLAPGSYRFEVQANFGQEEWVSAPQNLLLRARPFFYQTTTFLITCWLLGGFLFFALYRLRMRQLKDRLALILGERTRIARELHDTVLQGSAGALMQLNAVSKTLAASPAEAHTHLEQAMQQISRSLRELRYSIWTLREADPEQAGFADRLQAAMQLVTAGNPVQAKLAVTGTARRLPPAEETELLRLLQEAMTNGVQHAQADHLEVALVYDHRGIRVSVTDDGCGIRPTAQGSPGHFGLPGMQERATEIGAVLTITSKPRQGTRIEVALPHRRRFFRFLPWLGGQR